MMGRHTQAAILTAICTPATENLVAPHERGEEQDYTFDGGLARLHALAWLLALHLMRPCATGAHVSPPISLGSQKNRHTKHMLLTLPPRRSALSFALGRNGTKSRIWQVPCG